MTDTPAELGDDGTPYTLHDLIEGIEAWQMETEGLWDMAEDLESEKSLREAFDHLVGADKAEEAMDLFIEVNHMPIKSVR